MTRYYSTQRPVGPGTFPKDGAQEIHNYDSRTYVEAIGREAWGYIEYSRELSEKEQQEYELVKEKTTSGNRVRERDVQPGRQIPRRKMQPGDCETGTGRLGDLRRRHLR